MRCKQCGASFRLASLAVWVIQCGECKDHYCTKCMKRSDGICYCGKCTVLIERPPDINELMKLKPKDIQEYLNRHNITTYGLVEKRELVELLCNRAIPVKTSRGSTVLNKLFTNFENVIHLPDRLSNGNGNTERQHRSRLFERPVSAASSSTNIPQFEQLHGASSNTLPKERRAPPRPPQPRLSPPPPAEPQPTTSKAESSPLPMNIPKLEDFSNIEELEALSGKELKIVLTYNRVDYKGCVEKTELLEKVQRLWTDNQKHKTEELPDDCEDLCKLCMDAPLDCVLLECGHIATCIDCGKKLAECPICRQYVVRVVRTFKA